MNFRLKGATVESIIHPIHCWAAPSPWVQLQKDVSIQDGSTGGFSWTFRIANLHQELVTASVLSQVKLSCFHHGCSTFFGSDFSWKNMKKHVQTSLNWPSGYCSTDAINSSRPLPVTIASRRFVATDGSTGRPRWAAALGRKQASRHAKTAAVGTARQETANVSIDVL